ncbi:hypothetical protein FHR75_004197 [Kineococcus radiotolerans]|uniref:Antitoxin Xre/MbcA/ParS-like toxin-binding domain-containing protein n=1 Tax=Kineococcus radiotolerans TaxID=131568 RepID=A0A7W4TR10_KINRA|nr:hypothetical protein [Kineococcus radiotolerans]MBB2903355.1 hypothetical protein [Kineococcus radiotolerans]
MARTQTALVGELTALPEDDFLEAITQAVQHRHSAAHPSAITTALRAALLTEDDVQRLAGGPRSLRESLDDVHTDLRILTQAQRSVLDVEMLTSTAVAQALGRRGVNTREAASKLRTSGHLLGLPAGVGRSYTYPAFQLDYPHQRVHPVVAQINHALGALEDPWGVASWWVSPHPRLLNHAPLDLLSTPDEHDLLVLAGLRPATEASDAGGRRTTDEGGAREKGGVSELPIAAAAPPTAQATASRSGSTSTGRTRKTTTSNVTSDVTTGKRAAGTSTPGKTTPTSRAASA